MLSREKWKLKIWSIRVLNAVASTWQKTLWTITWMSNITKVTKSQSANSVTLTSRILWSLIIIDIKSTRMNSGLSRQKSLKSLWSTSVTVERSFWFKVSCMHKKWLKSTYLTFEISKSRRWWILSIFDFHGLFLVWQFLT